MAIHHDSSNPGNGLSALAELSPPVSPRGSSSRRMSSRRKNRRLWGTGWTEGTQPFLAHRMRVVRLTPIFRGKRATASSTDRRSSIRLSDVLCKFR